MIEGDTVGDLGAAYIQRGAMISVCDGRRQLAVETLRAERSLIDQWIHPVPRWMFWRR